MYFKVAPKGWSQHAFFVDIPFLDQMGYTALLTALVIGIVSYQQTKGAADPKAIQYDSNTFATSTVFNIGAFAIMLILVALYAFFWS
jgi:SSS family solute:Na+ symporter